MSNANGGWIKLHRSIQEHWVFQDPVLLKMWLNLLFMANYKPKKITVKGRVIELRRGQFWTSYRTLSTLWNMGDKTVKKRLMLFQSEGMIYVDSNRNSGTLVTIRNYVDYQDFSEDDDDTDYDMDDDTDYDKVSERMTTRITDDIRKKRKKRKIKKEKNKGLAPGDPDYVEEV